MMSFWISVPAASVYIFQPGRDFNTGTRFPEKAYELRQPSYLAASPLSHEVRQSLCGVPS
jgi:hypothetical protein